jgi:hypothetical protein
MPGPLIAWQLRAPGQWYAHVAYLIEADAVIEHQWLPARLLPP